MTADLVWAQLAELPVFRALIRSIEQRLFAEEKPFAAPILDVGVGDGHFAAAALGPRLDVGIDAKPDVLGEARRRRVHRALLGASAEAMPFAAESFATIVSNCVIEHVVDLDAALGEMHRTLRPAGRLLVSVPTDRLEPNLLLPALLRRVGGARLAEAYTAWFRRLQVHHHLLSRAAWLDRLARAGFRVVRHRGYLSARATRTFEVRHYLGATNLAARRLTGRWVAWPWRPRFGRIERRIVAFVEEPEHDDDSCLFVVAEKR